MDSNEFNPDEFIASTVNNQNAAPTSKFNLTSTPVETGLEEPAFDPDQFIQETYGTPTEQLKAGVEGVAQGIAGPFAPMIETELLGVDPADILARQEANPITHGIGEAAGLVGGTLLVPGVGAAAEVGGQAAVRLAAKAAPSIAEHAIGSSIIRNAAEMAVFQSSNEAAKMVLKDPDTSAESALSNIGAAAALGGIGGGVFTGVVSPLWKATAGNKVEQLLGNFRNHLNGGSKLVMPEAIENASAKLGIEIDPVMRAGLSDDPKLRDIFGTLRRSENESVLSKIDEIQSKASEAVAGSLGTTAESIAQYDKNQAGHSLLDVFTKEYQNKYEPIASKLAKRDLDAAPLAVTDTARLRSYNQIIEDGIKDAGTDSPYYKLYEDYGNRVLAKDTIGQLDKLKTEINQEIKKFQRSADYNSSNALTSIKNRIADLQENEIMAGARLADQAGKLSKELKPAAADAEALINARAEVNRQYKDFAGMSDELTNHLGIGDFRGAGTLKNKLTEKMSAEQLLNKFSVRNNADFIGFLQKNFPDTLKEVLDSERKEILKPAILAANRKGAHPIDVKKLEGIIANKMAGQQQYIEAVLGKDAIEKAQAAKTLLDAIPDPRNSGTPAGIAKVFRHLPASAMAAVGYLTGHNPIVGALLGETAARLGKSTPEAIKLASLKFVASDQPIKAEGFKAAVDYLHNVIKGEATINKAVQAVFNPAMSVAFDKSTSKSDNEKLDKIIEKYDKAPDTTLNLAKGDVGHYFPEQQTSITKAAVTQVQYLQSLKPRSYKAGPLDKPIEPSDAEVARYNRALSIANNPNIIMKNIKEGTIQVSDIQDLKALYPSLYQSYSNKLSNAMINHSADERPIPYATRMGISLFLGQAIDSSMTPNSIMAAQPKSTLPPQEQPKAKNTDKLGKTNKLYMTPTQSSELHKLEK